MSSDKEEYRIKKELRMNEYRLNNVLCDVTIQIEDQRFPCHQIVLASACEYFAAMFIGKNFEEGATGKLTLNSFRTEFFEEILLFIYTGKIYINDRNSYDLLVISDFLGLQVIRELCVTYIQQNLASVENIFEILQFAVNLEISSLTEIVVSYISSNFSSVSSLDSFTTISYDALKMVLQCVYSKFENPCLILNSVIRWIKFNLTDREVFISDLLVHLLELGSISADRVFTSMRGAMANKELIDKIFDMEVGLDNIAQSEPETENNDVLPNISPLNVYIRRFKASNVMGTKENCIRTYALNEKKKLQQWDIIRTAFLDSIYSKRTAIGSNLYHLYVKCFYGSCGYYLDHGYYYEYSKSTDRSAKISLKKPPVSWATETSEFQLCSVGNTVNLYTARIDFECVVMTCLPINVILRYNCDLDQWFSDVPDPVEMVHSGCLVSCTNNLYLLGGQRFLDGNGNDVQRYDYRTPCWQSLSPMMHPHIICPSACECDGKLYITGGGKSRKAEVFDPVAGKWYNIASMNKPRSGHQLMAYKNLIWAIGSAEHGTTQSAEVYNPKTNTWINIAPIGSKLEPDCSLSFMDATVFEFLE